MLSEQGLHQGLVHQAPKLSALAVSTPIPSLTVRTLLVFIAGLTHQNFAARSAQGRVPAERGGLCDAVAGMEGWGLPGPPWAYPALGGRTGVFVYCIRLSFQTSPCHPHPPPLINSG